MLFAQAAPAGALSLRVRDRDLEYGQSARLVVDLDGRPATGVRIMATAYPFGAPRQIAAGVVTRSRTFAVRPDRNTRFEAILTADPRARSGPVEVFMSPAGALSLALALRPRRVGRGDGPRPDARSALRPGARLPRTGIRR